MPSVGSRLGNHGKDCRTFVVLPSEGLPRPGNWAGDSFFGAAVFLMKPFNRRIVAAKLAELGLIEKTPKAA